MMNPVFAIARTTVAEAVRRRILYVVLAFAICMILLSAALSSVTLGWQIRMVTDVSLTAVTLCGTAMAVLLGVSAVAREFELRTVVTVISKPVGRPAFLLGKYLGVCVVVSAVTFVMWIGATVLIAGYSHEGGFQYGPIDYIGHFVLLVVRLSVVTAIAVSLSSMTSSTVGLVASSGLTLAGYFISDLRYFLSRSESEVTRWTAEILYRALPDLSLLDTLARLVHGHQVLSTSTVMAAAYAGCYAATALLAASLAFRNRDLG